jgi:hypothetical protein
MSFAWSLPLDFVFLGSDIKEVRFIARDLLKLTLKTAVIVNSGYTNPSSYLIIPVGGATAVNIIKVLVIRSDLRATSDIYLNITNPQLGAIYNVDIVPSSLQYIDGSPVVAGAVPFEARITKTDKMLKSLPSHYDTNPTSTIRNLITAISVQDDIIGGSRKDFLGPDGSTLVDDIIPPVIIGE